MLGDFSMQCVIRSCTGSSIVSLLARVRTFFMNSTTVCSSKSASALMRASSAAIAAAAAALAASLVGGLLAHFWFLPVLPLVDAIVLSVVAAAAGQVGDLCESLIKRSTDVKDSGTILPGHGGILDRSDALLFASAAVWVYAEFIF